VGLVEAGGVRDPQAPEAEAPVQQRESHEADPGRDAERVAAAALDALAQDAIDGERDSRHDGHQ
jgi:hypothetical protein